MNNTFQTLKAVFTNPDLENIDLFGGKIEVYHNYGSLDGVPLFRGYITQFTANDKTLSISAQDPRVFLAGKDGVTVTMTDKKNYDGYTLTQFLYSFIKSEINTESTVIGLSALTEITNPVYMTGVREDGQSPWILLTTTLTKAIDDTKLSEPLDYFTDIIHREKTSDIIFRKKKELASDATNTFTYFDGIVSLTYKERPPNNIGVAKVKDGESQKFVYGNTPTGRKAVNLTDTYKSAAEATTAARNKVLLEYNDTKEISLVVSKCHSISLGTMISIDVPDNNIKGKYRVTGKTISFNDKSITCSLKCDKKPIKLADYINN